MAVREFLDVDPTELRLPPSRRSGADPFKLIRQMAKFGSSTVGMPVIEVSRSADGYLIINDGVTRASRVAKLAPTSRVRVEVIDHVKKKACTFPTIGETLQ